MMAAASEAAMLKLTRCFHEKNEKTTFIKILCFPKNMGGIRGVIRDVFTIYVCYKLIGIWLFGHSFTTGIGIMVVILLLVAIWFTLERVGVL